MVFHKYKILIEVQRLLSRWSQIFLHQDIDFPKSDNLILGFKPWGPGRSVRQFQLRWA